MPKLATPKACHLSSGHSALDTRILRKECVSLQKDGYEVVLIAIADKDFTFDDVKVVAIPQARRILGRVSYDTFTRISFLILRLALKERADIYHFHDPHLIPVGLLLRLFGKRVIYDVHEWEPGRITSGIANPNVRRIICNLLESLQMLAARRFSGIVAATPFIEDRFKKSGVRCTNVNNFPLDSEILDVRTRDREEKGYVCYIGFISEMRGIRQMIEGAFGAGTPLVLCGRFSSTSLRRSCESLPGWGNVDYRGHVQKEEAVSLLSEASIGLVLFQPHPNHFDSQPNKLFEYMAAGIPVIASDFPHWRALIESGDDSPCGVCVDAEVPSAITEAIRRLMADPDLRRKMGESGSMRVRTRFRWKFEYPVLRSFYRETIPSEVKCASAESDSCS